MRKLIGTFSLALVCVMVLAASSAPAKEPAKLKIGQAGPEWKDLIGVDGKRHSLGELKTKKAVVVCFTCNHCPVAKAYEDRLIKLAQDYKSKDVALVAINVNLGKSDSLPAMKERAEEKNFNFQYLFDPTQEIGRQYFAARTPEVFLLDADRKLAYTGAVDDSMQVDGVKKHHLRDAIDAVLAGNEPETTTTRPHGCSIKYEKKSGG